jgi:hypothetical protein
MKKALKALELFHLTHTSPFILLSFVSYRIEAFLNGQTHWDFRVSNTMTDTQAYNGLEARG